MSSGSFTRLEETFNWEKAWHPQSVFCRSRSPLQIRRTRCRWEAFAQWRPHPIVGRDRFVLFGWLKACSAGTIEDMEQNFLLLPPLIVEFQCCPRALCPPLSLFLEDKQLIRARAEEFLKRTEMLSESAEYKNLSPILVSPQILVLSRARENPPLSIGQRPDTTPWRGPRRVEGHQTMGGFRRLLPQQGCTAHVATGEEERHCRVFSLITLHTHTHTHLRRHADQGDSIEFV